MGTVKLPLIDLELETAKEYELRLLPSLDMLKIKDKKDRGTLTIKVSHLLLARGTLFVMVSNLLVEMLTIEKGKVRIVKVAPF